jgi:hypothetical protein
MQPKSMTNETIIIANTLKGPAITVGTTALYWIGVITPYLAFIGLIAGLILTIHGIVVKQREYKVQTATLKKLEAEIAAIESGKKS